MSRQYYGIENLGLTNTQRNTLIDALRNLGDNTSPHPNYRNNPRPRPDNQAVIFEGKFELEDFSIAGLKNRLANLFGVSPDNIDHSTQSTKYGPIVTFTYGAVDYLRLVAFGGLDCTWIMSYVSVLEYITDYKDDWEGTQE